MPSAVPRAGGASVCVGPLPCESYSNSNSGRGRLSRHLLTAPLAALMIHSEAKETQGDFVFKSSTTAAGNGAKAEAVDGARLVYIHTQDDIVNMLNGFSNI